LVGRRLATSSVAIGMVSAYPVESVIRYPMTNADAPELDFTDHARRQMQRRRITEDDVHHVIESADDLVDREDGCVEYTGRSQGHRLRVVVDESANLHWVVTAYLLEN